MFKTRDGTYPTLLIIIVLALAFFITGQLGQALAILFGHYASLIWPPAGIALAGILIYGNRVWPGILLGAFLINGLNPIIASFDSENFTSLLIPLAISSGATLQALAGAYWLKRYAGFPNALMRIKDVLGFLFYAGVLSALINSTLSTSLLVVTGKIPLADALNNWLTWWTGDLLGIIIFTPLILAWLLKDTDAWRHRQLTITLPILLMFTLTAAVVVYETKSSNERIQLEFNQQVEELNYALKEDLTDETHALHALRNSFIASKTVNKEEFKTLCEQLFTDYQNIQTISWAPLIQNSAREVFEKSIQEQSLPKFQIFELDANRQRVTANERPFYAPVTFIEPYQSNAKALGYDNFSNPTRLTTFNRATDSGELTISTRTRLIQDNTQFGALAVMPIYRQNLPLQTLAEKRLAISSYVVGVLRISDVVTTAFKHTNTAGLSYRLLDSTAPVDEQLLYSSDESFPAPLVLQEKSWLNPQITLSSRIDLPFGSRIWTLEVVPNQHYFASHDSGQVWLVMLIGLLSTSLVSVLSVLKSGRTLRLEQLVNERTEQLELQHIQALLLLHEKERNQKQLIEAKYQIQRAEDLANTKALFLANMSHELRTPLTAIIGFSDLALQEDMSDTSNDYINIVNTASKDLLTLINDILDSSKLDAGQMKLQLAAFKLADIRTTLLGLLINTAQAKGLQLTINIEPKVPAQLMGDSLRLRQVLINLLGNAIKFTKQGSVTLSISLLQLDTTEARLYFAVTDTGIGINAEQQAHLFQAYTQVDDDFARNHEGTGLGLTISQNLVQLMGSSIKLDSQMGIGSCFSFELRLAMVDLAPIEADVSPTLTQSQEALSGVRILVVEDDLLVQKVINGHLKRLGASIKLANNGLEALATLEQQAFDVVLMDLHMPGMDGFETTIEIRKLPQYAQLPVIACSAGVSHEVRQRCLATGMNDFVAKPINIIELVATVERWLKRES